MNELSKIRKNGVDYSLKDTEARKNAEEAKTGLLSCVKSVNGVIPDASGNVKIDVNTEEVDPIGRESGLIVFTRDAMAKKPTVLKVYGRTVQNGTPSVDNPVIPTQVSGNTMMLYAYGKNLIDVADTTFVTAGEKVVNCVAFVPGYTYTLSTTLTKANSQTGKASLRVYDYNNSQIGIVNQNMPGDGKLSLTFTCPDSGIKHIYLMFNLGTEGDTVTFTNLQLEVGDKVTAYEAYNRISMSAYTITNAFHGIPVTSGGNYTDENGQQYICDLMDFNVNRYERNCGYIESYNGETIPGAYMSSTGSLTTGATVVYALAEPIVRTIPGEAMGAYNNWLMSSPSTTLVTHFREWIELEYERLLEVEEEDTAAVQAAFDPTHYGMTILWLDGDTTGMNKDDSVELSYRYKNMEGTASVKLQGSSSLWFPKKNYTIKFDQEIEPVEGWGAQKKFCFKANYIDHSHARNVVCAKLWGQVVKSRTTVPAQFANLPNGGAVDGIPCAIMLNGQFHGLYTWNIPKDGWMFGMGDGEREAILCAEGTTDDKGFRGTITELDGEYSYEYSKDKNDTGWIVESLNRLITACLNSDGTDLDTTVAQYLDWDSVIDSYIFTTLISGHDNVVRNYLLVTYDGVKWYFSQYDMDETFGQIGSGLNFRTNYGTPTFVSSAQLHRAYELVKLYKKDALKARYAQLRSGVMSELNVCGTFSNFIKYIPPHALMADLEKYPTIPSAAMSNYAQIAHYYGLRVKECDKEMESL